MNYPPLSGFGPRRAYAPSSTPRAGMPQTGGAPGDQELSLRCGQLIQDQFAAWAGQPQPGATVQG